jgi:4-amino-4-deoxy-L-arabinose transferase-like glycosyltransferase
MKKLFLFLFILITGLAFFIRFYQLNSVPPSLYWEEAALGYDAYSILKTGKDHHGQPLPVVAFTSFGDYKPSGYFYALVPVIAVFGLNEWSVRIPSAVAGVLLVIVVGLLARRFVSEKQKNTAQLLAMTVTAVSPWAIQFSRGGWEVNLATSLLSWGIYLGLNVGERKRSWQNILYSLLCFLFLSLSMYTYHATRIIAPILALALLLIWLQRRINFNHFSQPVVWIKKNWQTLGSLFITGLFFLLLISPLLLAARDQSTQQRFAETSIFADGKAVQLSNYYKDLSGNSIVSRLIFHRYIFTAQIFIQNYLKHFSPQFLFVSGDENPRHSVQFFGLFYPLDALFLLIGLSVFLKNKLKVSWFLVVWLLIGIVPAALTQAAPHALRTLPILSVYMILSTLGILDILNWSIWKKVKWGTVVPAISIAFAVLLQFAAFWRFYMNVYPRLYSADWQYGYSQMVNSIAQLHAQKPETPIYITREYGRPAMYYWFFTKTDPQRVQAIDASVPKDQGEYLEYENIHFVRSANEVKPGIVAVTPAGAVQLDSQYRQVTPIAEVKDLRNQTVWVILQVGE